MIYIIGGPPKCGKTTLAKKILKQHNIPWISTDTLQSIVREHTRREEIIHKFPYAFIKKKYGKETDIIYKKYSSKKIIGWYRTATQSTFKAVDTFMVCEIADGNDYIIEGLHIEPKQVKFLMKKYGRDKIKAVFLFRKDEKVFVKDIEKSRTPNDWIINKTKDKKTYKKIAEMICEYGKFFEKEAKKYKFKSFAVDDFKGQLEKAAKYLMAN